MGLRRRVYEMVEVAKPGDRASWVFDVAILSLIALNVLATILESVPEIGEPWAVAFQLFERCSVAVFTIEYILRIWSCVEIPRFARGGGRLRFALTPMVVVDLLAIAPAYLPMFGVDLRMVRTLRLFRLVRIAKMGRYTRALRVIQSVLVSRREELITSLAFMLALVVVSSSLLYMAEKDAQPEQFGSIPDAMWWAVVTLTTVGYGDIYPITVMGRVLAAFIAILGIGMVALPTSILGSGFVDALKTERAGSMTCPHCGKLIKR